MYWKDLYEESKKYKNSNLPPEQIRIKVADAILKSIQDEWEDNFEDDFVVPGCIARMLHECTRSEKNEDMEELGYPNLNPFFPFQVELPFKAEPGSCKFCKSMPCHTIQYGRLIECGSIVLKHKTSATDIRRLLCNIYRDGIYNELFGAKLAVPECIIKFIKEECEDGKR